jgi:hypothetical protein
VTQVIVHVRELTIPEDLLGGDYQNDPLFRERIQAWVRELWEEKDRRITQFLADAAAATASAS